MTSPLLSALALTAAAASNTTTTDYQFAHVSLGNAGEPWDLFGIDVAVNDGIVVVGAPGKNSWRGAAYVFDSHGTSLATLEASDGGERDYFGGSVAVNHDRIVIGACWKNENRGAAYAFDLDWQEAGKYLVSDAVLEPNDLFGGSVAVDNDIVVVSARGTNNLRGAAYVFDVSTMWFLGQISANDGQAGDLFGLSVDVDAGRIVAGAHKKDGGRGSAYVFARSTGLQFLHSISASDGEVNDWFGHSVVIDTENQRIVIGARGKNDRRGAAYVFSNDGDQLASISASDAQVQDNFGYCVAVDDGTILVSASQKNSRSGGAYAFDATTWQQLEQISARDAEAGDVFGFSLAVDAGTRVVGAQGKNNFRGQVYILTAEESFLV